MISSKRLEKEEKRQAEQVKTAGFGPQKSKVPSESPGSITDNKSKEVLDMDKLDEDEEEQAEDAETAAD